MVMAPLEEEFALSSSLQVALDPNSSDYGQKLYQKNCQSCHMSLEVSSLKSIEMSNQRYLGAIDSISAMGFLKNRLSEKEINAIVALFKTNKDTIDITESGFTCNKDSAASFYNSSIQLRRLSGKELSSSYQFFLGASVWNSLSNLTYLIPEDRIESNVSEFINEFSPDTLEKVSRFNKNAADKIVLTDASVKSFFGTCASLSSFSKSCFNSFFTSKGKRILKSPILSSESEAIWTLLNSESTVSLKLSLLVQVLFNHPRYLYHYEVGVASSLGQDIFQLDSYELGHRLSFGLMDSPPDDLLWQDIENGKILTDSVFQSHIERFVSTSAFNIKIKRFFRYYLGLIQANQPPTQSSFLGSISSESLTADAEHDFDSFINYVVFERNGTFADLFTTNASWIKNSNFAKVVGLSSFSATRPNTTLNHIGILAKPYFTMSGNLNTKMVSRGRLIRTNLLCSDVPQPTASDISMRPTLSESDLINLSQQAYVDKATMGAPSCIVCHSKMNAIGFLTNNFDSLGRFVTSEKIHNSSGTMLAEKPISINITPKIVESDLRSFSNLEEFQSGFSKSDLAQACFSRRVLQFSTLKSESIDKDSCQLSEIDTLVKSKASIKDVFLSRFKSSRFKYRKVNL